jgi:lysophospholipase L1-like esterase
MTTTWTTPVEETDPYCLPLDVAAPMVPGHPFRRVVVLGDSVAAGVREPTPGYLDLGMADRLEAALRADRPDLDFTNLGTSGLRVAEVVAEQLDAGLRLEPDLAVVSAGGNDAMARAFDADRTAAELTGLARRLADAGAQVVLIGLFDPARTGLLPADVSARMRESFRVLDEVMHAVAAAVPRCVVSDNRSHPLSGDAGIISTDRIHCNARGHAVAAATLLRDVARLAGASR